MILVPVPASPVRITPGTSLTTARSPLRSRDVFSLGGPRDAALDERDGLQQK